MFDPAHGDSLLSVEQMYLADRGAIAAGTPGLELMERAGAAVAEAIGARFTAGQAVVLCGPGNNGGDGFVVARLLQETGWRVRLGLLGERDALKGDAAAMAARWRDEVMPADPELISGADLVVDALFGAGLARPLDGAAAALVEAVAAGGAPSVAVDMPSGVDGDSGHVRGTTAPARLTVTFCRAKPGHLLLPGRALCGELVVADIGIDDAVVAAVGPKQWRNSPGLWCLEYPWPDLADHKYARGHTVVVGGEMSTTGAARMAARAALRVGSGLVTVAASPAALSTYAAHLTAVMLRRVADREGFAEMLTDPRMNAVLLGPGQGVTERTREFVATALEAGKNCVLDADALTVFADAPAELFERLHGGCVLTPHDGEFARLFEVAGDKLERTRQAARSAGAIILLKGADTVIAAPDGRAVINDNAPPDLATAGSGDVLSGLIAGLMAQGVAAFEAAAMAAWLHGSAGQVAGPGLIAEDLPEVLPDVLRSLKEKCG
jgi:NAD(P)H-hydrate epimerase